MRPRDRQLAQKLDAALLAFDREVRPLFGIRASSQRDALIEQLLESTHRVKYVWVIRNRKLGDCRADPHDERFDPIKAAIIQQRQGRIDEAFWLVFLSVHFGKNYRAGWRYVREVYGRLGDAGRWDWPSISSHTSAFRQWLAEHQAELKRSGVPRGFGNHRKYQSLDAYSPTGTGAAVATYVNWVDPPRTHQELMQQAYESADHNPSKAFDMLYRSMHDVASFGRTARFDYLTMIGNLGMAHIFPGSVYMHGSTGPLHGARLLFAGNVDAPLTPRDLDDLLIELDAYLMVGMQVLEDALCNWQKSPNIFRRFRG